MTIGILAFGSLMADPGWEIKDWLERVIPNVLTPFPVEYARRSSTRQNAPTLVQVPEGKGIPVRAAVLVLKAETDLPTARNILYRREIHRVGDSNKKYRSPRQGETGRVVVAELDRFAGVDQVLYTCLPVNFHEILDETYDDHEKAELLSIAARESLTQETFYNGMDGIQYLAAAKYYGVNTRLTDIYTRAILALAGGAPDLAAARAMLARVKNLV